MREIKFRARDKNREEMVTEGGFIQVWGNGDYAVYHEDEAEWESSDHIIIEYTGLKDKNGTEIYEGDIVKCPITLVTAEVRWNNERAGFVFQDEGGIYGHHSWEVIGNIWEQSHLLDTKTEK